MPLFAFLLRASWQTVALAGAAALVSGASSAGLIALANAALARYGQAPATLVWGFAALCLVVLVARTGSRFLLIRLTQGAVFDLQRGLARRILAAPLRRLEEAGAPRLLAALTDDVQAVSEALPAIPILATNVATVLGCLVYLAWLSWPVLLAVLGVLALGLLGFRFVVSRAMRAFRRAREARDALFGHFRALTEGIKDLKLRRRRRDAFLAEMLEPTARLHRRNAVLGRTLYNAAWSWNQTLYFATLGVLVFALPALTDVPGPTIAAFTLTFIFMMAPLDELMDWLALLGRANVAVQKIEDLGLSLAAVGEEDAGPARRAGAPFDRIELVGATHRYHHEREERSFTLGPIDLTVRPGEILFVVGGNGTGKTTLGKVLAGLYPPEQGEVRLDGRPVTDGERVAYRELFSAVFSDTYLFDRLLGLTADGAADLDARARDYLARLELDHKVQVERGALSTTALSQGQRKRLALLAAYLDDRPVYLFDEWASDQDPLFKEVFYRQVLQELRGRGKAVVVITHDDRYFDVADRVVKLEAGRLVAETGPGSGRVAVAPVAGG